MRSCRVVDEEDHLCPRNQHLQKMSRHLLHASSRRMMSNWTWFLRCHIIYYTHLIIDLHIRGSAGGLFNDPLADDRTGYIPYISPDCDPCPPPRARAAACRRLRVVLRCCFGFETSDVCTISSDTYNQQEEIVTGTTLVLQPLRLSSSLSAFRVSSVLPIPPLAHVLRSSGRILRGSRLRNPTWRPQILQDRDLCCAALY
jgi:hypothetical protein